MPLAMPVLAVVGMFAFVGTLNEFLVASVLLNTNENLTLAVGLQQFVGAQYAERWGPFAAGVLLAMIPAIVLFMYVQKYIISGLTQGSVKG